MNGVLYPLCAGIAWVSLLFKIPALVSRRRTQAGMAVASAYLFMGLTFTISDPRVWALIDRMTGVPNLALLLSQGSVIGIAASQLATLTFWEYSAEDARPRARRIVTVFLAVFAVMTVLFSAAELTEEETTNAVIKYAGHGLYTVYLMVYVTAFAVAEYAVVARCLRYARAVEGRWLKVGLRLAVAGGIGGLIYVAARYADLIAIPLELDPAKWEVAARLGAGLGGILTLIGWSLPGWGPQLSWWRDYRAYRSLHPLWAALHAANPDIALDPSSGRGAVRDLDFRLHRRVVEIRDGQRWLRPFHDQDAVDEATRSGAASGLSGDDLRAHTEAAGIATALARRGQVDVTNPPATQAVDADPVSEVAWLVRVARAYTALERV